MHRKDDEYVSYVEQVWPRLYRTAYALCGNQHEAEDLLQSVLVKVYGSWSRVSRADNPDAYVRRMLVNEFTSWRRRGRTRTEFSFAQPPDRGTAGHERAVTDRVAMWQALALLPPRRRAVVVLRYYEGLSEQQIAAALGIAPGTVKSQCSAALKTLRGALGATLTTEGTR